MIHRSVRPFISALVGASLLVTLTAKSPVPSPGQVPGASGPALTGLAAVFVPGTILRDGNGDDRVDLVSVRIVVSDAAPAEDVAAAAAVAARLGLETSGISFPITFTASEVAELEPGPPAIIIGAGNPLLPADIRTRLESLDTGHGLVVARNGTVVIAGRDGAGTQAAGEAFAARSPYLWAIIGRQLGETFDRVATDAAAFLAEEGVEVSSVSFGELVYAKGRHEAVSASVTLQVSPGQVAPAHARLEFLAEEHGHGRATDRLNYASAAQVIFHVFDGSQRETVTLPRVGLPRGLLNRPRREPTRFETTKPTDAEPTEGRTFDLSEIFATDEAILLDRDRDQIPDDTDTMIVVSRLSGMDASLPARGVTQLAARLGLESTGLTLPLLGFDEELEDPEVESRPLILLGRQNRLIGELDRLGKLRGAELGPGQGRIEMVPTALNESSAIVVTGGDLQGDEAALDYLSRRLPHIWEIGKGTPTLEDVQKQVRKVLEGRTTASQAALAHGRLEELLEDLDDKSLESVSVTAHFEEPAPDFDAWLSGELSRRLDAKSVEVRSQSRMDPDEVFRETPELVWEVDTFWEVFRSDVLPSVGRDTTVSVELRVSESPELRRALAQQIRSEIEARGGRPEEVLVLSAYKQGLSWLMDSVAPALEAQAVAAVSIGWKPFPIDPSTERRFYNEPARWLNELYPADEVLAKTLDLPSESITFQADEEGSSIYSLTARDAAGEVLLRQTFSPTYYERPYLNAFPDYADATVTTGWLRAEVNGSTVVDRRMETDLDRIWDHYQGSTLVRVYDHIKSSTSGEPTSDKAPYFHTLRAELKASEPDFKLDVDQEHVSSLESLHDSFYFDTLDFMYEVAETASVDNTVPPRSLAVGNILPWVHAERRGEAPELTITYSGFASKQAKLVVTYKEAGQEDEQTETIELEPEEVPEPYVYLAETKTGAGELSLLGLLVTLPDTQPLPRLTDLLENLTRLQRDGVFTHALGFTGLAEVAIRLEAPGAARTRIYASTPDDLAEEPAAPYPGSGLVTWDHVISPAESERIAHTLGTTPNVNTYVAGRSYQGRPVSVMEITLPMESELVSQAKLSTWKPTLSIVGRQHANEVSSTSHILRLAELLAVDPGYQGYLEKMNVVVQPVVNPDGAALAYELQKLTPTHCLHAGRYSALGPDVPREADKPDTLLTEALVLSEVNDTWVPDIRLNPHGYPSHEWVQHFGNYNPKAFRAYWIPRGWYTSARAPEHPQLDAYRQVVETMRERIAAEVSRDPESRRTNARIYDRYQRWAIRWQPHVYNLEIQNDTAIYASRRDGNVRRPGERPDPVSFAGGTEAMDETAQGPWLDLVTRMGFGYLMASVNFLNEAEYSLYRLEAERQGRVHLSVTRARPLKPGAAAEH